MRKLAYAAIAATMAVTLAGCAGAQSADQEETLTGAVGDRIEMTTTAGDIAITVDGFETNQAITDEFVELGHIEDGKSVGLLKMTVENISFDAQNGGYVPLSDIVYVKDESGVTMNVLDRGKGASGEYEYAVWGQYKHPEGATMRVAMPLVTSPSTVEVTAVVGGREVPVPVEAA